MSVSPPRVPVLRTDRLRLVAWEPRHFDAFAQMHADADTMRHIGEGRPLDTVEAWLHLAMLLGHWELRGYGVWALEDVGTGALAGRAGLFHPAGWPDPELNWMIGPAYRGQGFATEAARAVLNFAFDELCFERIISLVRPGNAPSARVVAKLGGAFKETIDFLHAPMQVFHYARPSPPAATSNPSNPSNSHRQP